MVLEPPSLDTKCIIHSRWLNQLELKLTEEPLVINLDIWVKMLVHVRRFKITQNLHTGKCFLHLRCQCFNIIYKS